MGSRRFAVRGRQKDKNKVLQLLRKKRPLLLLREFLRIEFMRTTFRNRERLPFFACQKATEVNQLADVVGIMRELARQGFHDCMALIADVNDFAQIILYQRVYGVEKTLPTGIPSCEQFRFVGIIILKLRIAVAPGLFAVGSEKVGETAQHIAAQVLHDDGYAVAFWRRLPVDVFVADLGECFVAEFAVILEEFSDAVQVVELVGGFHDFMLMKVDKSGEG